MKGKLKWLKIEEENPDEMRELFPKRVNGCLAAALSIIGFIFGLILFLGILLGAQWLAWALSQPTEAKACELPKAGFSVYIKELAEQGEKLYTDEDLELLTNVIYFENRGASDRVLELTGAVVLNRMNRGWADGTMYGVVYQGYKSKGAQQYDSRTIERIGTEEIPTHYYDIAKRLLIFGTRRVCPENVVYQGMSRNGSGVYYEERGEIFCYE